MEMHHFVGAFKLEYGWMVDFSKIICIISVNTLFTRLMAVLLNKYQFFIFQIKSLLYSTLYKKKVIKHSVEITTIPRIGL